MIYLLDSNICTALMNEKPIPKQRLQSLQPPNEIVTCTIVRGEILFGIEKLDPGRRRDELLQKAERLFEDIPCEPITAECADRYAQLKTRRQRAGNPLDENDLWIAATALVLDATLVSHDSDFRGTEGLRLEDWMTETGT